MSQGQANTQHFSSGLKLLLQARDLASDLDRGIWDFAVEKETLNSAGFTNNDLRSLICRGIVGHAYEVMDHACPNRQFCTNAYLVLNARSCFVLRDVGVRFAKQLAFPDAAKRKLERTQSRSEFASDDLTPAWDPDRHQLRLGSTIVKQYKFVRASQETILAAFDEVGWPRYIENPLPKDSTTDAKMRLHDAIESLNRNQRIPRIRFDVDLAGAGVCWALKES